MGGSLRWMAPEIATGLGLVGGDFGGRIDGAGPNDFSLVFVAKTYFYFLV